VARFFFLLFSLLLKGKGKSDRSQYLNFTIQLFLKQPELGLEVFVVDSLQQARALVDGIRRRQGDARPYGVSHGLRANG
jgi:hypothetical protein